jgi:hypothetical protein
LLSISELKTWLHQKGLKPVDKLLLILASYQDASCQIKDLKSRAIEAGFKVPKTWNLSSLLSRCNGLAIRTPTGWEITEGGKQHLRNIGVTQISSAAVQVAIDLRSQLVNISDDTTLLFVEEAIKCYELELYRSAIVMSWLAAMHILYLEVFNKHLSQFNTEVRRVDPKWKDAIHLDDFSRMKERDFLDKMSAISIIGKNVKNELIHCLDRRNSCGHPNSLKIGANTAAHHIEVLLLNVFKPYC